MYLMVVIHNAAAESMWKAIYIVGLGKVQQEKSLLWGPPRRAGGESRGVVGRGILSCCDIKFNSKSFFFFFANGIIFDIYSIYACRLAGQDWQMGKRRRR